MSIVHFITYPEVVIDPSVPVPDWPLSPEGISRMALALNRPWMGNVAAVFCSAERKAIDAAQMIADRFGLSPAVVNELGKNDRSATGYLPKVEFEVVADAFFAHPDKSVRGWERAADAQHLLCHLKGVPISRTEDQPAGGGGNVYSFDNNKRTPLTG